MYIKVLVIKEFLSPFYRGGNSVLDMLSDSPGKG